MASDKRSAKRFPTWLGATLGAAAKSLDSTVRVIDLSALGAAVEATTNLLIGEAVQLSIDSAGLALALEGTVVSVESDALRPVARIRFGALDEEKRRALAVLLATVSTDFEREQRTLSRRVNTPRHEFEPIRVSLRDY